MIELPVPSVAILPSTPKPPGTPAPVGGLAARKVMVLPFTDIVSPSEIAVVVRPPTVLNNLVADEMPAAAPVPSGRVLALAALRPSLVRMAPPALSDT